MASVRTLLAITLVVALVPAPATAADAGNGCFPDEGERFDVGSEGPGIDVTVHTSLFTNPLDPGAFGVELYGTALDQRIVTLRTGVRFDGVDGPGAVLADPFGPFSYVFEYTLQLPMFAPLSGGTPAYESDAPLSGPVERAEC